MKLMWAVNIEIFCNHPKRQKLNYPHNLQMVIEHPNLEKNVCKSGYEMINIMWVSRTSLWRVHETPWAQGGPHNDTWDLWCRWWEGLGCWEYLQPMETKRHEGKAINCA